MPRRDQALLDAQRRTAQQVRTMAGGGMEGRTSAAAPLPERPRALPYRPARVVEATVWSTAGNDVTATAVSDIYEVLAGGNTVLLVLNLSAALTGDTDVDLLVNGASVGTVTVASGQTRGEELLAVATVPGDLLAVESTAVGTGSATATVQAKIGT